MFARGQKTQHSCNGFLIISGVMLVFVLLLSGCGKQEEEHEDRVVIEYWEKWAGFEGEAMRQVVDDFNAVQDRIFVKLLTVSKIDRKLMLATAGGNPPDVAGLYSWALATYVENGALLPLDRYAEEAGIRREDYIDIYWDYCEHRGILWALPTTPATIALHWNKKLFREAGLDPEKPPRTLAELEEFNERLLKRDENGRIIQIGHHPQEPGWWGSTWVYYFGGDLWDGGDRILADSSENLEAMKWLASYPERFGRDDLLTLRDGFGNFASPQNAFFQGRVAMVLQGVWMYNFIKNYAPEDFEWGVAPFPNADPEKLGDVTLAEADLLVIPKGAKHPREAFEFIRYVNTQEVMEKLCMGQRKFTPFKDTSEDFIRNHPNPYIETFIDLAKSSGARRTPPITTWTEFREDSTNTVAAQMLMKGTPQELLQGLQERQQQAFDRKNVRWKRVAEERVKEWEGLR